MSLDEDIIEDLNSGLHYKKVAEKYPLDSLSIKDKVDLFLLADDSKVPSDFIKTLYLMLSKKDYYYRIRALVLLIRHPDPAITQKIKKACLEQVDQYLKNIKKHLVAGKSTEKDIRTHQLHKAAYFKVKADIEVANNELTNAIGSYERALKIYEDCDQKERSALVKRELDFLRKVEERGQHLLPLESLKNDQIQIEIKLGDLTGKKNSIQEYIDKWEYIGPKVKKTKEEMDHLKQTITEKKNDLKKLDQEIDRRQSVLHFLMALPKAATAPLWVEVVRLSLEQGILDELTLRALERISICCPDDAIPLLLQVAARSPEPFTVDIEKYKDNFTEWMSLINKARMAKENNPIDAAQILVDAWELFFNFTKRET